MKIMARPSYKGNMANIAYQTRGVSDSVRHTLVAMTTTVTGLHVLYEVRALGEQTVL